MNFLSRLLAFLFSMFVRHERQAGAKEEREKINVASEAKLQRQDEVANRTVTDNELQKSLKDGTF